MRRTGPFNGSTRLAIVLAAGALAGCASVSGDARQAKPSPVVPPATPPAPDGVNPFAGARLYVNPDYVREIERWSRRTRTTSPSCRKWKGCRRRSGWHVREAQ